MPWPSAHRIDLQAFVYAAAIIPACRRENVLTPASVVDDSATTFTYGDQIYEPRQLQREYSRPGASRIRARYVVKNATVKVAEAAGYDKVAELARNAGISALRLRRPSRSAPYDATPIDMAGPGLSSRTTACTSIPLW